MDLNGVLIGTEDPERLVAYYAKLFGEPTWNDGGYSGWMLGQGALTVGPHSEVKGKNPQPGRILWNLETPDVRGEFERLTGAGASVVREPYLLEGTADGWVATFADPDDNYFQLMSPLAPPEV